MNTTNVTATEIPRHKLEHTMVKLYNIMATV